MKKILLLTTTLGLGTVGLLQCAAEAPPSYEQATQADRFLKALDHLASIIRRGAGNRITDKDLLRVLDEEKASNKVDLILALDRAAKDNLGDMYIRNYQNQEGMPVTDAEVKQASDDFMAVFRIASVGDPVVEGLFESVLNRDDYDTVSQYIEDLALRINE
ncbi:MAG: hypothetical protein NT124_00650 [Candidatus Dependentiae bacterium]|nr:hypothetical protein [Candidatus Dependentiae bacterium]